MQVNADGDVCIRRKYVVQHLHAGRLLFGIYEEHLQVVADPAEAKGQVLIHREQTREFVAHLRFHGLLPPKESDAQA